MTSIVCPKKEVKPLANPTMLLSNLQSLNIKADKTIFKYDIEFRWKDVNSGTNPEDQIRWSQLCWGKKDQHSLYERSALQQKFLDIMLQKYQVANIDSFLYDGAAILFALYDFRKHPQAVEGTMNMHLEAEDIPKELMENVPHHNVGAIEAIIKSATQLKLKDFKKTQMNNDMKTLDRSHMQFFNMLTNTTAMQTDTYVLYGNGSLSDYKHGISYTAYGTQIQEAYFKGIKFAEGTESEVVPMHYMDSGKNVVFQEINLKDYLDEILGFKMMDFDGPFPIRNGHQFSRTFELVKKMLHGMVVYLEWDYVTQFSITTISRLPIGEIQRNDERGQEVRVVDQYGEQWGDIDESYPAVVFERTNGRRETITQYFPMECLRIAPHQKVSVNKQFEGPPRAPDVSTRFNNINTGRNSLNLNNNGNQNQQLKAYGITVSQPLQVPSSKRPPSTLQYGASQKVNSDRYKGPKTPNGISYIEPALPFKVYILTTGPDFIANKCMESIRQMAETRGVRFEVVMTKKIRDHQLDSSLNDIALYKKQNKIERLLVVFVHGDKKEKSEPHAFLKLFERKTETVTQQILIRTAKDVPGKRMTCSNILNKMNCKMGGTNYIVHPDKAIKDMWISKGDVMVAGYDVCHTGPKIRQRAGEAAMPPNSPSIVGFASNCSKHCLQFVGDFHYQMPGQEQVSRNVLQIRFGDMFRKFQSNRGKLPRLVLIYRDGVSEGQYAMAMNEELAAIRDVAREVYGSTPLPKFVFQVVTKRHGLRFCKQSGKYYNNTEAGTVVETVVVRPDMTEFYIQPHRCCIGTAKFVGVQVLVDEFGFTLTQLEDYYMALAHSHQIIDNPISLPEPVYLADVMGERGKTLWEQYVGLGLKVPKAADKGIFKSPPMDFEEMTKKLSYLNTKLDGIHISA